MAITRSLTSVRQSSLWLFALCVVLVFADAGYGLAAQLGLYLPVSPGVASRGTLFLVAGYVVLTRPPLAGASMLIWLTLLAASILPSVLVGLFTGGDAVYELTTAFKALYLPVVTALGCVLIRRYRLTADTVLKFIEASAYTYAAFLLVPSLLQVEVATYGEYAEGAKGLFYAGNDVGIALGLSLFAAGYRLVFVRYSTVRAVLLCLSALACVRLGSRASLAALAAVVLVVSASALSARQGRGAFLTRKQLTTWAVGAIMVALLSGALFYGYRVQTGNAFQEAKLTQLAEGDLPRLLLMQAGLSHLSGRSSFYNLVGEGADRYERGVAGHWQGASRRMTEVDWLDSYGRHGLVYTVLAHLFVLAALLRSIRVVLVRRQALAGVIAGAILIYLGHSALAGHALFSPTPSTLLALYLAILATSCPQDRDPATAGAGASRRARTPVMSPAGS